MSVSSWTAALTALRAKAEATIGDGGTAAIVPGYDEIPDGADLEGYADLFMRRGYEWNVLEADTGDSNFRDLRIQERSFALILSREVNIVTSNTGGRADLKGEILAHAEAVRAAIAADNSLGGAVTDAVWVSDGGIQEIFDPEPTNPGPRYYVLASEYLVKIEVSEC